MMLTVFGTMEVVVKPTTILRLTTPPIRSAGRMERVGEVTTPPISTVGPLAVRSTVEDTETPVSGFAGLGDPIVAPVRVMIFAPLATAAEVAITYGLVPVTAVGNRFLQRR